MSEAPESTAKSAGSPNLVNTLLIVVIVGAVGYFAVRQFGRTTDAAKDTVDRTVDKTVDLLKDTIDKVGGAGGSGGGSGRGPSAGGGGQDGSIDLNDVVRGVADVVHETTRVGTDVFDGALGLSVDEEWYYGRLVYQDMLPRLTVSSDPALQQRVDRLAKPILAMNQRTAGRAYTFTIVDEPVMNAFATIGGNIFIYTGLIDQMQSDRALQFVIGHEIGHVELGHCAKANAVWIRASELGGDLAAAISSKAYQLVSAGFSEDQEFACDSYGFVSMRQLGYSKAERLEGVKRLDDYARSMGRRARQPDPRGSVGKTIGEELANHFRTHPPTEERMERLERMD